MPAPTTLPASASPLDLLRLTLTAPWPHDEKLLRRLTVRALRDARALLARRQAAASQPEPAPPQVTHPQADAPAIVALPAIEHSPRPSLPDNSAAGRTPTQVMPRAAWLPRQQRSPSMPKLACRAAVRALRARNRRRPGPEMHVILNE